MRLSPLLLLLIGLFAVALNTVHGKEEEDETVFAEESVSDDKEATVEVVVNHLLPDNPFNMIVNGEVVPLLLSVVSKHTKPIKVVGLEGRFTQPQDFSMIFRNISRMPYYVDILPNQESTIEYRFRTDFEPAELGLVVDLEVVDERDRRFRVTAFQQVLKVADPVENLLSLQMIFLYIVGLALLIGVGYLVQLAFFGGKKPVPRKSIDKGVPSAAVQRHKSVAKLPSPVNDGDFDEDWIPTQHFAHIKKPAGSKKKQN